MAAPPPARAVVFDLDDTLFPERRYVRSGYAAVGRCLRERLGTDEPYEQWLWRRFQTGRAGGAFDALNEHFSLDLNQDAVEELVEVYRTHRPDIRPFPGATHLLAMLHQQSHRLGLLTDGYLPAQRLKLDALKIGRFFDAVVFTEELGRDAWKPSTKGFELIRERLGVDHERCAYVADNPAKDFVAPNRLGWRTVQLRWWGQVHADNPPAEGGEPQHVACHLEELRSALREEE